jgi:serine/threonine protein kinase
VPILDVLQVPDDEDRLLIVMPLLRPHGDPRFDTVGEAVEFIRQIFEGVQFMHKNHVAHRDIMAPNIMMDATPLFPVPYHPFETDRTRDYNGKVKHYTRTQRPVNYYITDFGISRRYSAENVAPLEEPIWGGDKTVPEFQNSDEPRNPYHTDIYYLGNFIRLTFLRGDEYNNANMGFEFMAPLVTDMVQDEPSKRPTIDEVVTRFEEIRKGLSSWKLRSRVSKEKDNVIATALTRVVPHWARRVGFIAKRVPAIPTPKPKKKVEKAALSLELAQSPPADSGTGRHEEGVKVSSD